MSRSKHHGCGRGGGCPLCRPEKKWPRKGAKDAQYERPAVRRRVQKGKDER